MKISSGIVSMCIAAACCWGQSDPTKKGIRTDYFLAGQLPGGLGSKLDQLGPRWQKAGEERVTYALTLNVRERGQNKSEAAVLTIELPNLINLERPGNRKVGDDGEETWKTGASAPDDDDLALLETVGADSIEGLLESVRRGAAIQFVGSRFRLEDSRGGGANAPVYDVYAATIPLRKGKRIEFSTKTFFFNSESGLLEIVRYEGARGAGLKGAVETRFTWQRSGSQYLLKSFQRREGEQVVADGIVSTAAISSKSADGKFKP